MKLHLISLVFCTVLSLNVRLSAKDDVPEPKSLPSFDELFGLVRSNVKTLDTAQLNQAAVRGLLDQLNAEVVLVDDEASALAEADSQWVTKKAVYEEAYGYIRIAQVKPGLAKQVQDAHQQLISTNQLKGLVIDLRFAAGDDYPEAAKVADLFITDERPLLELGETILRSTSKNESISLPVVVLVNEHTAGATEALAASMRHAASSLVIGKRTAGRARVFKEFTLTHRQKVKVAVGNIRLDNSIELSPSGLVPDVPVSVTVADEKAYWNDPYVIVPRPVSLAQTSGVNGTNGANRLRRPRNEADLIRLRREGLDLDAEVPLPDADGPSKPVLNDPALARAVDFLKGLALVQNRR